jgi:hypothetical protein
MFARAFTWVILMLPLLFGAISVAPAAASDHHQVTVIEVSSSLIDQLIWADGGDNHDLGDHVHDTPPMMAETALAATPPEWMAAWASAQAGTVVRILPCLPDEPPKRMA